MKSTVLILLIFAVTHGASTAPAQSPDNENTRLALVGGTLIDGSGAPPVENSILLVNGEFIEAVGQVGSLAIPAGYAVISTDGRTIMPGLWDMHVHLLYAGHTDLQYWHRNYTGRFADTVMPATALQLLQSGVTSARDLGAPPESIFQIKRQIANREIPGPVLYAAGPQLTPPPPDWAQFYRRDISGPGNAAQMAVTMHDLGADVLKITGLEQLAVDEVRAVTAEAHDQGLLVTAHGRTDDEIRVGLAGGVDEFQHIGVASEAFPDEIIRQIEERIDNGDVLYWTPTVGLQLRRGKADENREVLDDPENYLGLPTEVAEDVKLSLSSYNPEPESTEIVRHKIGQLRDAGVTLLVGTDGGLAGNPHAQSMWQEMLAWVEILGIDALETIHAATGLPAEVMGVDDVAGTLTAGKYADILVIRGDPRMSMTVLADPELILQRGRQVPERQ